MSVHAIALAVETAEASLPFPALVFAAIAAVAFLALGVVVWSFRDVANRHSQKTNGSAGHGSDHH